VSLGRWRPEHTAYIRSFSKSHGPDLRLAALSAPAALHRAVTTRRELGQGWSSRLLQQVLLGLLTSETARAEVAHASTTYAARRAHVVDALAARGVEVPGTEGINIWVPVHDETAALVLLASRGIGVAAGAPFRLAAPATGGHVRVTVGAATRDLDAVADALADAALAGGRPGRAR
jgi:DNA-binding transcriptional MocR family regulator